MFRSKKLFFFFCCAHFQVNSIASLFQSSGAVWFIPDLLTLNLLQTSPRSLFLPPKEEPNHRFCSENFVADHSFNQTHLISAASLRLFGNEGVGGKTARMGYKALGVPIQTRTWPDQLKVPEDEGVHAPDDRDAAGGCSRCSSPDPQRHLRRDSQTQPDLHAGRRRPPACRPPPFPTLSTELFFFFRTILWKI